MVDNLDIALEKLPSLEDLIKEKRVRIGKAHCELNTAINEKAKAEKKIKQRMKRGEKLSDPALDYAFFYYGAREIELNVTAPLIKRFLSIIEGYVGQKILIDYSGKTITTTAIPRTPERVERKLFLGKLIGGGYEITVPDRSLVATATNWQYLDLNEEKWKATKELGFKINDFLEVFIRKRRGSVRPVKIAKDLEELEQLEQTRAIRRKGMEITLGVPPERESQRLIGGSVKYDSDVITYLFIGDKIVDNYLSKLEFQVKTPRIVKPGIPA